MSCYRTVGTAWRQFAAEHGEAWETAVARWLEDYGVHQLPDRYRWLVTEVILRLPEGWSSHCSCTIRMAGEGEVVREHYAEARLSSDADETCWRQAWEVVLNAAALNELTDAAIRGCIAHELAHVGSALLPTPEKYNLHENRADNIAKWWGFEEDLKVLGVVW